MARADALINRKYSKGMSDDFIEGVEGVLKEHVGPAVYRGRYPTANVVSAVLIPGSPDTYVELKVEIDWENLPRPEAPEGWQITRLGLCVPESDLKEDEKKDAVPLETELAPKDLRNHCRHIRRIIRLSLAQDPIWNVAELGWHTALANGFESNKQLGVEVVPLELAVWDATDIDTPLEDELET